MNELSTTSTHISEEELALLSIEDADELVVGAVSNLETAARIYKREKLTQPQMVERLATLGIKCSTRSLQRVFSDLRKSKDPDFKPSQDPEAIKSRKRREGSNRQNGGMTPSQTPTFIHQNDDCISESVQQQHARIPDISPVSVLQPDVDTYGDGCSEGVVSMGTSTERDSHEGFKRIESLIDEITELHRRYFNGGISEFHWQDLSQQYDSLKYFADIRWQRHRAELERGREEFDRQLDKAVKSMEQSNSSY